MHLLIFLLKDFSIKNKVNDLSSMIISQNNKIKLKDLGACTL